MDVKRTFGMVVALVVAVIIVSSIMVPVISTARGDVEIIDQEGAGWLRMAYQDSGDYSVSYSVSGDTVTIGTQSGSADDMIVYADSVNTTVLLDGKFYNTDSTGTRALADSFTISRLGENVTIDGESAGSPTYAYVPAAQGTYGFFDGSVPAMTGDSSLISFGSFAGLTVSDKYTPYGLVMNSEYDGDYLESTTWAVGSSSGQQTTQPVGSHESAPMLYSVPPTPTYTDGDWGYELSGSNATIVSYSGQSGQNVDIIIPSTVGGYSVSSIGKGQVAIFNTSSNFGSLTISSGITSIMTAAFSGCHFTGELTLPSSVTTISNTAFANCSGLTGTLTLPTNLTSVGSNAFLNCSGFTGTLTIPSSVTFLDQYAFSGCSGFTGTLTIPSSLTSLGPFTFNGCSGFTGTLTIPSSVTSIGKSCFKSCSGFTGTLTIPSSLTSIGSGAFSGCTGIRSMVILSDSTFNSTAFAGTNYIQEVLNLSNVEYTKTSYGLNAEEVLSDIPGSGFLAPTEFREGSQKSGPVWSILSVVPLIVLAGIVFVAANAIRKQ